MDPKVGKCDETWPAAAIASFDELRQHIDETGNGKPMAWRGQANWEWMLESTLDRRLDEIASAESYEQWLGREAGMIARFRSLAWPYASEIEKRHLERGDLMTLALGRHAGLPTRLIDWTWSPWVAAWFACHTHSDADGLIWWFDQEGLEDVLHSHWDEWGVKKWAALLKCEDRQALVDKFGLEERALEPAALDPHAKAWVSKIHYGYPCPRMEAQQGFITTCGRLRKTQNVAFDELPDNATIRRGRIRIPAALKGEVLRVLRTMNIHARSLEYPGVDIVARSIDP